jgi:phytoene dehydrogenase-like protein
MNVALSELPDFICLPGKAGGASPVRHHHRPVARLHGRGLARREGFRLVEKPIIEMLTINLDETLAPPAKCRQPVLPAVAPRLSDARSWDDTRDEAADLIIDTVNDWAPNFRHGLAG